MKKENPTLPEQENEGGIGPIVGSLIIVTALIIGAVYYWGQHLNVVAQEHELQAEQQAALEASEGQGPNAESSTFGTSTKISDIEKDLDSNSIPGSTTGSTTTTNGHN